ncbi:putative nucleotidyltransferase substrate binding domain-containing protein [Geobacter sulfurreducens]|jgi:CBS domain-containing protein|uniref:putative nucleotidyltransferase substrate binding domain-containing protein n=1 Tax=Geobacter sulfurreducens TaxID=35554 RepID=UPI000DBB8270|nr:putative nucleotidyltransferase substrate binding domain-containing protein [Geobacter sulfurreducens]BBA70883.1 Inosine-5'-monophosphate dehydrogenase [Geobacter sulfurreducens]
MTEENFMFQPVGTFCQRQVVTCAPGDRLVDVAATMSERNISSVVVCKGDTPAGIVTDRDLRNKVVARGADCHAMTAGMIMNAPLITVGEDDSIFEALHRMSRRGIHRVCVVDGAGRLTGIITDSDILRLQSRSPQQMVREIEEACSVADLGKLHVRVQNLVVHLAGTGVPTRDLVRMIAHLNDQILVRLITLLRRERYPDLTDRFAFIVLGSEGRQEQTLTTDQDNAIVYADDLSETDVRRLEAFSIDLIDNLVAIGVPPCPGGIMARNEAWRRSLSQWRAVLDQWLSAPTPENILNSSMFMDMRLIDGDHSLEQALKPHIAGRLAGDTAYLAHMGANVVRFTPPLGMFGRIKVERSGDHRGLVDLKKAGIFAITEGVKILALEAGLPRGGTWERLQSLVTAGTFTAKEAEDLEESFNFLVLLRLRGQVEAIRQGLTPTNHIPLDHLNRMEQGRLRLAFEEVRTLQAFMARRFRLDLFT